MDQQIGQLKAALADRYAIERELGAGGMATVYLAEDLKHRRKVAIKVLRPDIAASVGADRFLREIEIAAGLTHPHILSLHDSGEADGLLYYVMPYVDGETLRQRIMLTQVADETPLPPDDALAIARDVAQALAYAHRKNVIHRDIKPENILLAEGHPVVADFGIARAVSAAGGPTLTQSGLAIGTPRYMSPEQAMGETDVDGRTDIYSLGLVLYEMLVGELPRTASDRRSIAEGRVADTPTGHRNRLRALPPGMADVLTRTLAEDPNDRFATATELADALASLTTGGSAARPRTAKRSHRFLAGIAAATVLAGAATAAWLLPRSGSALAPDRVLVSRFANQTGDTSLAQLGMITADWLTRGLQETGMIQVVDARSVADPDGSESSAAAALALARDVGAGKIVSGAYYLQGDSLRIQARVTETETGVLLAAVDPAMGLRRAPLEAVERLGQRVMGVIASLSDEAWPITDFRAPTYEAYREYVTAIPLIGRQDIAGAVNHFLRASALDTAFTMPLIYAAAILMDVGQYAQADSLRGVVDRFRPQLRIPELHMMDYLDGRLRGNNAAALEALRPVAEAAPLSEAPWEVGQLTLRINRPREAIEIFERLDPTRGALANWWFYWSGLGAAYHVIGDHETELAIATRARTQYPDNVGVLAVELSALAALGRLDPPSQWLDQVRALTTQGPVGQLPPLWQITEAAMELRAHGHLEAADAALDQAWRWIADRPGSAASTMEQAHLAVIAYLAGQWEESQERFQALAAEFPSDVNYQGYLGALAARRSDRAEALRMSAWLEQLAQPYLFGINTLWQARIGALLGEPDRAVVLLRTAIGQGAAVYGTSQSIWISRTDLTWLHRDVDFESLRDHPLFQDLLRPNG